MTKIVENEIYISVLNNLSIRLPIYPADLNRVEILIYQKLEVTRFRIL